MADAAIPDPFAGLQGIFDKILGASTATTDHQTLTTEQMLQQLLDSVKTGSQTTTGTTTGTSTTTNNADIAALQKVFQQQQAGVTPEMLAAIFKEGSKSVPSLVSTTANAVGARPGSNSALATTLSDLNNNLVSQAAQLNTKMLQDSAGTASQIAELTKQQSTTQQQTSQQMLETLLKELTSTTQNNTTDQEKQGGSTSTTGINVPQTATAAALAGLTSLLGPSGADLMKSLIGTGGTTGGTTNLFNPYDPTGGVGSGFDLPPGTGDYGGNPYVDGTFPDDFNFADGGIVENPAKPKLLQITDTKNVGPSPASLLSLLGGGGTGTAGVPGGGGIVGIAGGGSDGGVGSAANPGMAGPNVSPVAMMGLVSAVATGNIPGLITQLAKLVTTPVSNAAAPGAGGSAGTGSGSGGNGPVGSVSIGAPVGDDGSVGSIGNAAPGDSVSVSGPVGDSADSSGDSSGDGSGGAGDGGDGGGGVGGVGASGWANGGVIPRQKMDPAGINDGINIRVSGGEAIIPHDVVDMMGPDFFTSLIALYHTPAAKQKAVA